MKRVGIQSLKAEQRRQLKLLEFGIGMLGIEIQPHLMGIDQIGFLLTRTPEGPEFNDYTESSIFQHQIDMLRGIAEECDAIIAIAIDAALLRAGVMTPERDRARDFRDWLIDECNFQVLQKNADVVFVGYDPTGPLTLASVIADLERDAALREHQSKHGSPLSSMAEDAGEGMTARVLRKLIAKLKRVASIE